MLGKFCSTITNTNIETLYKSVNPEYIDDFWQLICDYNVYQIIHSESVSRLIDSNEAAVWNILQHSSLSMAFGKIIADHLLHNRHTPAKLISHFLAVRNINGPQLHFPTEFTQEMRNAVLSGYIDRDDANLNHLQLLEQAQSTKEFPVSDRLKLKARKRKEVLQEKLFSGNGGLRYGAEVSFKSIPDGSIEESHNDNVCAYAYSREWIEENHDYPTLLNNFIHLFGYVDQHFRCGFTSLQSELGIFERELGIKGKKDYPIGIAFNTKQLLSLLQMAAYRQELHRLSIQLEDIFKWFFEEYLKNEFGATGFTYSPPSTGTTYAEKCKLLAIAIDGTFKQYRLFCEDGFVDRELLEMSSGHIVFNELESKIINKYAYLKSNQLHAEMNFLFSDQSILHYTEKTRSNYRTLPQLLLSEKMTKEDFAHYQQSTLDWLIKRGVVYPSDDGHLLINKARTAVLRDLFYNEVICPTYYNNELKQQVDALVAAGDMCYEKTLFSRPEQDYLNYALNKSEFSNGFDLRNKYSHDTCPLDEKTQITDYLELLKIMVLVIIKINEELCLSNPADV